MQNALVTVDAKINRFESALLLLFYAYFIGHLYHPPSRDS